jgi:multidrug resistance efflux pump
LPELKPIARAECERPRPYEQKAFVPVTLPRARRRARAQLVWSTSRRLATLAIFLVAGLVPIMASESTRDGSVRVQVASVAPQVSGQITQLRVTDNQLVHKGDIVCRIEPLISAATFRIWRPHCKSSKCSKAVPYRQKLQSMRVAQVDINLKRK